MSVERRRYPREEVNVKLYLLLNNQEVPVNVRNLSKGGALVQVKKGYGDRIATSDIGRVTSLAMEDGSSFTSSRAVILRCTEEKGKKFVALSFEIDMV